MLNVKIYCHRDKCLQQSKKTKETDIQKTLRVY